VDGGVESPAVAANRYRADDDYLSPHSNRMPASTRHKVDQGKVTYCQELLALAMARNMVNSAPSPRTCARFPTDKERFLQYGQAGQERQDAGRGATS